MQTHTHTRTNTHTHTHRRALLSCWTTLVIIIMSLDLIYKPVCAQMNGSTYSYPKILHTFSVFGFIQFIRILSFVNYLILMLGLHIATMRSECQKSPLVMEDHEFDQNLMVWTRGFTHCHELLRCVTTNGTNCWRIVTNHYVQSRILSRAVAIY